MMRPLANPRLMIFVGELTLCMKASAEGTSFQTIRLHPSTVYFSSSANNDNQRRPRLLTSNRLLFPITLIVIVRSDNSLSTVSANSFRPRIRDSQSCCLGGTSMHVQLHVTTVSNTVYRHITLKFRPSVPVFRKLLN